MPELIRLNIPFIVVLLLAAVSFAIVYFFYRRTNPEISPTWKIILIVLRSGVLFLILLLFFEPAVHLFYYQKKYPMIDIFVDNSQSMGVREGAGNRWQQVEQALQTLQKHLKNTGQVRWFRFNSRLRPISRLDSLKPSKSGTDFVPVLKYLQKDAPDVAFFLSDGVITEGGLPADLSFSPRTTVYCVPIGQVHSESDVFVQDAEFSPVAYKGQPQTVTAIIGTRQWKKKQSASLILRDGKKVVARKTVTLSPGAGQMRVALNYVPKHKGLHRLEIRIAGVKNDANSFNNVFRFVQDVLRSKIHVALLASAPNYDVKFLHLLLQKNPKFAVSWFVEDNQGRFLQKSSLNRLDSSDVLFFAEYPGVRSSGALMQRVKQLWNKRHPSLALMADNSTDWPALTRMIKDLPFKPLTMYKKEKQVTVIPNDNKTTNAFLNLFSDRALNQIFWTRIPPVTNYFHRLKFTGKHTDLLSAAYNGTVFPVVFTMEQAAYKLLVLNGQGFWQWHFLMQTDPDISSGYRIFLEKLIGWLAYKQRFNPVLLTVNQKSGHIGQSFDLTVRLVDSRFKPVTNGSVLLKAQLGKQSFDLSARESEQGVFKARFVPHSAGIYRISAIGIQQDQILGNDSLQIAVVPMDKEFIHLSPDTLFLQRLSRNGGGKLVPVSELNGFLKTLVGKPRTILKEKRIELWYRWEWLILIILLITIEWALRKKLGLV